MEFKICEIEELIAKYEVANTTLVEEQYLQQYFTTQNVPPHLQQYVLVFGYFKNAKKETLPQQIFVPQKMVNYKWLSVAVLLIFAVGFYTKRNIVNTKNQKKEVALAYKQTKLALQLLSNNFNKGTEKIAYLVKFEKIKHQIFKNKKKN